MDRVLAEVSSLREENRRLTKVVKDLEKNTKTRRTLFKQAGDPECSVSRDHHVKSNSDYNDW